MKNILFVIAMEKEAIKITKELGLNKIYENEYSKDNISLIITGIGKQLTAINLVKYLDKCKEKPDMIINMGYAGSTRSEIGSWVNVCKSFNYEWNIPGEQKYEIEGYNKNIFETIENEDKHIKKLPCYTAESFVTKTDIYDEVVFDMELHSIYLVCCIYNIKLLGLKKISDNLSLDDYYKNLDMEKVFELNSGLNLLKGLYI